MHKLVIKIIVFIFIIAFVGAFNYGGCVNIPGGGDESISGSSTIPVQSTPAAPSLTTNPANNITQTTATLRGTINPNGISTFVCFQYGTTTSYNSTTNYQNIGSGTSNVNISANLTGLLPNTTYNFRIQATRSGGAPYNGANQTFTTVGLKPTCATNPATNIASNAARLNGTVNPNGTATNAYFNYGTTTSYGNTTEAQAIGSGISNVPVNANTSGLSINTPYNFRVVGTNLSGTTLGNNRTFTTGNLTGSAPTCMTDDANNITYNSARLNGTVIPNGVTTNAYFQWGTTTSYGNTTTTQPIGNGTISVAILANTSGLSGTTTYNFRVVATNSGGQTNGLNQTFTTSAPPPTCVTNAATNVTYKAARLNGTVNPNGADTNPYFEWGTTTSYENTTSPQVIGSWASNVSVNADIIELLSSTQYNFRVVATNSGGTTNGLNQTFTTNPPPPPPTCTTNPATNVNYNSATLNGTVNPNGYSTTVYFQYGITATPPSYTDTTVAQAIGSGNTNIAVAVDISALSSNTVYNFRCVATNSEGTTTQGTNRTFGNWLRTIFADGTFTNTTTTIGSSDVVLASTPVTPPWNTLSYTPANIGLGGGLVIAGSNIYVLGGNGTTNFWLFSSTGWYALAPISATALVYPGTGDYIYALQGGATANFYRYAITTSGGQTANTWISLAATPAAASSGCALVSTGGNFIYALGGWSSTTFWRYAIAISTTPAQITNTWVSLAATPATVDWGGALVYPGGDLIYALRGNNTNNFWSYSISGNSWNSTTLATTPATVGPGGALTYPGIGNFIYAFGGNISTTFWSYAITGTTSGQLVNTWIARTVTPASVGGGGALASSGPYIFALGGNNTTNFWYYTIASFNILATAPAGVYTGSALAYPNSGDYIYALGGNGTTNFWRYSISGTSWSTLAATPSGVYTGSALAYPGSGDYIYALGGNGGGPNNFWRYAISTNLWSTLANTPANVGTGASLAGSGNFIYAFRGDGTTTFWRYAITTSTTPAQSSNTWVALASTIGSINGGGSLLYPGSGNVIYALDGGGTSFFRSYSISGNTWSTLTSTPSGVYEGGELAYLSGSNFIYALGGNNSTTCWRYSISGGFWTAMTGTPANVNGGGTLTSAGSFIYAFGGGGTTNFWSYQCLIYSAPGIYVSTTITATSISSWGILTFTYNAPTNTTFSVDVLGLNGTTIVTSISSGSNLSIDYPGLFNVTGIILRANFGSDTTATPILSDWGVGFEGP
ncbi:MAG: hypothetical protein V1871_02615 [Planctomycetota bacterium]